VTVHIDRPFDEFSPNPRNMRP